MKTVILTLLVALCGAASQFDSREGLTHVVRVGKNGRQVVHRVGEGVGQKVGKKIIRQGRKKVNANSVNDLVELRSVQPAELQADQSVRSNSVEPLELRTVGAAQPLQFNSIQPLQLRSVQPGLNLVNVAPAPLVSQPLRAVNENELHLIPNQIHAAVHDVNPFGFQHAHFNSLPVVEPAHLQPAQVVQVSQAEPQPLAPIESLPPAPIAARVVPEQVQPLNTFATPLQHHTLTHILPEVQAPVQPLASVVSPLQPLHLTHFTHHAPIQQAQLLTPIQSQPLTPAVEAEAPAVIAARVPAEEPVTFKSIPLEFGNPATIAPVVRAQAPEAAYGAPLPAYEEPAVTTPAPILAPAPAPAPVPAPAPIAAPQGVIIAARNPEPVVKSDLLAATKSEPIAIIRSHANVPANSAAFDYSFESANGIKQEAAGSLRTVDENDVSVMKGSYQYVGPDNNVYTVDWYADETGFHASAPHLPKSVEPNHPEVAAAVKAQLAFAAEQRAKPVVRASASETPNSYLSPAFAAPAQEYLPSYE